MTTRYVTESGCERSFSLYFASLPLSSYAPHLGKATSTMPFGVAHTIILKVAQWASGSFFDSVEVINGDNVPKTGPVIM